MKKHLFFPLIFAFLFAAANVVSVNAQTDEVQISSFVRDDCKHCHEQEEFFAQAHPEWNIKYYDLAEQENQDFFVEIAQQYDMVQGTPITLVRDQLVSGFGTAETTGALIEKIVAEGESPFLSFEDIRDGGATVTNEFEYGTVCEEVCEAPEDPSFNVTLPLIGKTIDVGKYSLGAMSLVLGFVDGFNPCAMWVLIMFLLVLSQVGSRKRMLQYAGIFILAEAIMYYLILTVWLTAWDFVGLNHIVTPAIGLLALGSGIYFVYKFFTYKEVCNVASLEQQQKISNKVKELAKKPMTVGVFIGILLLAFSVNIFEFACSIGIPQTFTKILELNNLSWAGTQGYMLLYILMYMVDDVIVFAIALYAIEKIGVAHKYSKWATLVGGILMLLLGALMLLSPESLVF